MVGDNVQLVASSIDAAIQKDAVGTIPSHWQVSTVEKLVMDGTLAKIQDGNHGESHPVSSDYVESGVPFIMSGDIRNGRVDVRNCKFLRWEHATSLRIGHAKKGDVLLTHKGNDLGRSGVLRDAEYAVLTPQVTYYRIQSPELLNAEFLRWQFESPRFQHQFKRDAAQSTRPFVSITNQQRLFLALPPIGEQHAIAAILGALDDKIELNRRMNATLEAMAQALFQSWFVDFDPVRAKLDCRQPVGMDAAMAALFPGGFQDSSIGHIPSGWKVKPIGEVVECVGGGTPSTAEPRYWEGGSHYWATPKDLSALEAPILLDTDRKLTDAGIAKIASGVLPVGTLLLSSRAPVGYLAIAAVPVAINQGFIAMRCNDHASNYFMLNWCKHNMDEIEGRATGTTFAEISKQNFRPIPVVLPSQELMNVFNSSVAPLYARISANSSQSRTLASLRDTLLTKLLTGELSMRDFEGKAGATQ